MILIVWFHFITDFIFQTDQMAINKSSSIKWLFYHICTYTPIFFWFGWKFALINGFCHFITDFFTSKAASWLWKHEERHWFFIVIGFDQTIHITTLYLTAKWFNVI
jgi:hypothetical protein